MNKIQDEIKTQNNPKPIKKLKPLKPVNTSAKPSENKEKSDKKPEEKPLKKSDTKKTESKKSDKPKPENKKPERKGFFESVKDMMYASADDDAEEETENKSEDIPEEKEDTKATLENISEVLAEINDELPTNKPEETVKKEEAEEVKETEKTSPEQVKKPENNNSNNSNRKKKNKNKNKSQQKNNSADNKKTELKPEKSTEKSETVVESKPEELEKPKEPEKTETVRTPKEVTIERVPAPKEDYTFIKMLCATFLALVLIIGIRSCVSGKTSSDDKYRKAIYPAVITDINSFENPSELPVSQILSTAVWSVIIDNEKLSAYPQRVDDMAIIPAEDIEKYATEIFGEDIPELTHSTILTSDSKFYYNEEANSYTVEVSPHNVAYTPEVTSVSKKSGKYIVEVNYIDQHPEWIEDTVSKTAEYVLSKNGDGYMIESMHVKSDNMGTTSATETTTE